MLGHLEFISTSYKKYGGLLRISLCVVSTSNRDSESQIGNSIAN